MVVAQFVEWSLLPPEIHGSNSVIGKILSTKLSTNEAPSDVNKMLDCCSYRGIKMTPIANQKKFFVSAICNRFSSGTSGATYR